MTQKSLQDKRGRRGWKIGAFITAGVLVAGGAVGIVTAPTWAGLGGEAGDSPSGEAPVLPGLSDPVAKTVSFGVTPTDGAVEVNPATVPEIRADNATIADVELRPAGGGTPVEGALSEDDSLWTADQRLAFNTEYSFEVVFVDGAGQESTHNQGFTTVAPANEANAFTYPVDGATVGTGQTIEITFSEPVINKDDVEEAIEITSTSGQGGAFYWLEDTKVRYRPQDFWEPNSTITIDMKLFGVDFGNGMIGNFDKTNTFQTHSTRLAVVDNKTKDMKVYIDGKLDRTFPVTLGTEEWPSFYGYYTVMEQYEETKFTAESIGLEPGDDAYYEPTLVNYASRISNGGAFVHEALPAAQSTLGLTNVSHGCVGMSPEGAKYFYDVFGPGDMVQILNTSTGPVQVWDGFGDWNVPWSEWTSQPS
ncbi:Ig-like domain-containing protein [Arthrobacter sp. H5]|uniref:L,D-transpeptidase n=1 Tax=Arthrobacter sp. H5 TaxID=1267973 RepID=UPI000489E1E6|nr:Ig-like domain-containing protein [Arthrobacter sp. H5]